jgi:hypothetical protein
VAEQLLGSQEGIRSIECVRLFVRFLELFVLTVLVPRFNRQGNFVIFHVSILSEHQAVSPPLLLGIMATRFTNGNL